MTSRNGRLWRPFRVMIADGGHGGCQYSAEESAGYPGGVMAG